MGKDKKELSSDAWSDAILQVIDLQRSGHTATHASKVVGKRFDVNPRTLGMYACAVRTYLKTGLFKGNVFTGNRRLEETARTVKERISSGETPQMPATAHVGSEVAQSAGETPIDKIQAANDLFSEGVDQLFTTLNDLLKENMDLKAQVKSLTETYNQTLGGKMQKLSERFSVMMSK